MNRFNPSKYTKAPVIQYPQRQWPNKQLNKAPQWCSVDLRDGNQALVNPMSIEKKLELFELLIAIGFKDIEVGFPAASTTDYEFVRHIIEHNKIPDDVRIQVLTQAREDLIATSFKALEGCKQAVMHVYNSTSPTQRKRVFKQDKEAIKSIAIQGAQWVKDYAEQYPNTDWTFQYSPESFSQTEPEYAIEVCNAVLEVWQPKEQAVIINLPATVEVNTPNVFADMVEYVCENINNREDISICLHTHNDRGCAIAAAELGLLAGADRIEGTLFGNGERTGNMDIITMAMNLYSQGINPELALCDMNKIAETAKACTELPIHPRHPYAGELVYTAFSGSHQDAIKKCLEQQNSEVWQVAYLPINPADLGRDYDAVIRINSQSGKGGSAFIIEQQLGITMPRWMQIEFSKIVQAESEKTGQEVSVIRILKLFEQHFDVKNNKTIAS